MPLPIAPPSRTGDFALVVSLDDALDSPVRDQDETDETFDGRLKEWFRRMNGARETGNWAPLLKPGKTPTLFWCRQVPGSVWRAFDRIRLELGELEASALVLQMHLIRIENGAPNHKLERVTHVDRDNRETGIGPVVSRETIDLLDTLDPRIVTELGHCLWFRRHPSGN